MGTSGEAAPRSDTLREVVGRMPSGSFAFVMATGIISTAFATVGWTVLSIVLLVIAILALVVLVVATVWRFVAHRAKFLDETREPRHAFGFFTTVAAINVVGIRLYSPESPGWTIALAIVSVPIWLLCSYGVPSNLMLRPKAWPGVRPTSTAAGFSGWSARSRSHLPPPRSSPDSAARQWPRSRSRCGESA